MAPSLAERPEYLTVTFSSCLLQWSSASMVPILLMVLLLLLCIHFKRKNRHFSTRPIKRDANASRLIRVTPLAYQSASSPEEKQPSAGTSVQEGGSVPSDTAAHAQRQANGFPGNSRPQPGASTLPKDLGSSLANCREERESRALGLGSLGSSSPAASPQPSTAPESLQRRELPVAGDGQVTIAEQPSSGLDTYGPIYESIRDKGIRGCQGSLSDLRAGPAEEPNVNSGRAAAGGEENEPGDTLPRPEQLMADRSSRGPGESPEGWQELTFEEATAVDESLSERERLQRSLT
nr:uncharacterized protein LOC102462815 [Pelodiscus sinensis]|eukprot:XP_025037268.1 uncharacterized protein LOC102462815 [Pelodiscus sinensis]